MFVRKEFHMKEILIVLFMAMMTMTARAGNGCIETGPTTNYVCVSNAFLYMSTISVFNVAGTIYASATVSNKSGVANEYLKYKCQRTKIVPVPVTVSTISGYSVTGVYVSSGSGLLVSFPTPASGSGTITMWATGTVARCGIQPGHISRTATYPPPPTVLNVGIAEFDRVAPTETIQVAVTTTPSPLPTGCSISLVCETDTGTTGSATVSPTTINQTTTVTITGGSQSWGLGNNAAPNNIKLRAILGSRVCDEEPFTVCAHPVNFSTSRSSDLDGGGYVGVVAQNDWGSDSGARSDMNKAQRKEVIGEGPRDNPPFTLGGSMVSGYIPADSPPTLDVHGVPRSSITAGPAGSCIFHQLFEFKCDRCGVTDQVCPNSGFEIKHELWNVGGTWKHKCTKKGAAVTIGAASSSAGSGNATSDSHTIP